MSEETYQDVLEALVITQEKRKDNQERVEKYHKALYSEHGEEALKYLHEERGLVDSTIKHFKLGLVHDPLPVDRKYAGAISIPYITPGGVYDVRFRRGPGQPEATPKYMQAPGTKTTIYNVNEIEDVNKYLIIGEGEFTAIMAWQIGLPAVAIPGVTAFKPYYRHLFEGFSRVYICGDGDEAGEKFNNELSALLYNATPISLPDGEDVDSFCRKHGAARTRELILGSEG